MEDITATHWHDVNFDYVNEMENLGKERLVVSAVIVCGEKVLLVRRSPKDSHPGLWEFPGGGVDNGESVVDAIRREVLEETAIVLPELPRGEVLTHPTRTALRIVMRFDLEELPDIVLSHEHDDFFFAGIDTIEGRNPENMAMYNSIRKENRQAALLVLSNGNPLA